MSWLKKLGKGLKKVALPLLGLGASFIPGVGPAVSKVLGSVGSMFGMGGSQQQESAPATAGPGESLPQATVRPSWWQQIPWGGLASAGSAALGYMGQQRTNASNAQMAQQQMDFQERQSSTSYQRGVDDMQKAGLNPMLAYSQGGASASGGSTAQMGNELGSGVSSAMSTASTLAALEQMTEQTAKTRSERDLVHAQTMNTLETVNKTIADTGVSSAEQANIVANTRRAQAHLSGDLAASAYEERSLEDRLKTTSSRRRLSEYEEPGASKAARYAETPMGWLSPALSDAKRAASTAQDIMSTRFPRSAPAVSRSRR